MDEVTATEQDIRIGPLVRFLRQWADIPADMIEPVSPFTDPVAAFFWLIASAPPKDPPPSNEHPPADRRGGPEML